MKYESPVFIVRKFETEEYIVASAVTTTSTTKEPGDESDKQIF